jgi:hypothetical protein
MTQASGTIGDDVSRETSPITVPQFRTFYSYKPRKPKQPKAVLAVIIGKVVSWGVIGKGDKAETVDLSDELAVFGISRCHTGVDVFDKQKGKEQALERANDMLTILGRYPGHPRGYCVPSLPGVYQFYRSNDGLMGHAPAEKLDEILKYFWWYSGSNGSPKASPHYLIGPEGNVSLILSKVPWYIQQ